MKNILLTCLFIAISAAIFAQDYSRVKVFTDDAGLQKMSELGLAVDHGDMKRGYFFISDFSAEEIALLKANNFHYEILISDVQKHYVDQNKSLEEVSKNALCPPGTSTGFMPEVPVNFELGSMAGFYTYQEMLDNLDSMQALYPSLISVKAPIGTFQTHENRPIYWVRISDNPSTDEATEDEVLYSAIHHAREPNSMTATIFYMWYLLENYANSEEIQHLLENTELYFVPCLNPDGYLYNELTNPNGGGMHRKNRRNVGTSNKGVDLNRNYSYAWGTTGISFNPDSDTYPGTAAFSEPETQAMKWFCENHEFKLASNAHSYSDLILYPFGASVTAIADDNDYFDRFTAFMVQYNGYTNQKSSALYESSGDSDDYMYNDDLNLKPEILALTPEIGTASEGFWPPINKIIPNSQNMVFPNLMLAHLAHRYLIVEDQDPMNVATASGNFNHIAERIGLDTGNVIVQIQPLQNIATVSGPLNYDLAKITPQAGSFAYTLVPGISINDTIKYVLETVYPTWTHRDTIVKFFGTYPVFIFDDASVAGVWTGNWITETHTVHSPTQAYSDSDLGTTPINYGNNANKTFLYASDIDLTDATYADVSFFAKWDIEVDFDYCQFQVSTNNGATWVGQCGIYTVPGNSDNGSVQPDGEPIYEGTKDWVREEISLSDYLGQIIEVRFVFRADGGLNQDGFYFDDFVVHKGISGVGIPEEQIFFTIYPNPANSQFVISSSDNLLGHTYFIMDMNGKIIAQETIDVAASEVSIATDNISNGIYTLVLGKPDGGGVSQQRLVLLK